MCRIKNVVRKGTQPRTAHIPRREEKTPQNGYYRRKRYEQILRKTQDGSEAYDQYAAQKTREVHKRNEDI